MTRPYGALPCNTSKIVPARVRELLPISDWNGVPGGGGQWVPTSTTETITLLYMNDKLDKGSAINFRVLWSSGSSTITDTATFRILVDAITPETDALPGVPTGTLSTAIAADACSATANILKFSPQGILDGETIADGDALVLALNVNAVSGLSLDGTAGEQIVVHGVEIEYTTTYVD